MILSCLRCFVITALLSLSLSVARAAEQEALLVFGAASLTDTLQKVSDEYTRSTGTGVKLSFAASSALAKQIEAGAHADVFMAADQEWMDYLEKKQLLNAATRHDVLGNRLALIAPGDSKVVLKIAPNASFATALGANGRLATGDPDSVPAGKYAREALISLHLWDSLQSRLARAENVRVALAYVARGETPLGIVYATDAAVEPKVRIVDLFPESLHQPIKYPVAATHNARQAATEYIRFLQGDAAKKIFTAAGFSILDAKPTTAHCADFQFDLSNELKLFSGKPRSITAAAAIASAPTLAPKQLYEVLLIEQAGVRFVTPPAKSTIDEGSYAGLLRIPADASKTRRVTLDEPAWIDVLDDGRDLGSIRHTGSHNCERIRKSVEFSVTPGRALVVQLSGSTEKTVRLAVTD